MVKNRFEKIKVKKFLSSKIWVEIFRFLRLGLKILGSIIELQLLNFNIVGLKIRVESFNIKKFRV